MEVLGPHISPRYCYFKDSHLSIQLFQVNLVILLLLLVVSWGLLWWCTPAAPALADMGPGLWGSEDVISVIFMSLFH